MTRQPILLLTTGGTIDKLYFDALSDYQVGDSVIARMLEVARVTHPFRIVELMRKDSLELTDADRAAIRAAVLAAPEKRIVITHGTDTMTDTARALADIAGDASSGTEAGDRTDAGGRTIVLVGALAPARFAESDAAFNLGMAFACVQVAVPGVHIAMNGTLFDGLGVVKDRARGAFVPVMPVD